MLPRVFDAIIGYRIFLGFVQPENRIYPSPGHRRIPLKIGVMPFSQSLRLSVFWFSDKRSVAFHSTGIVGSYSCFCDLASGSAFCSSWLSGQGAVKIIMILRNRSPSMSQLRPNCLTNILSVSGEALPEWTMLRFK